MRVFLVTGDDVADPPAGAHLVLSLFPGIDLLGRAFEREGFCVVRGPDLLWGGDIRDFHARPGRFEGIIAGSPCQDFSAARRAQPTGYGREMLDEFRRVVDQTRPRWWLLENVARIPDVHVRKYRVQRLDVNQSWYQPVSRLRHVQYGRLDGYSPIQVPAGKPRPNCERGAMACDGKTFEELCRLQGLPPGFDLPGFTVAAKKRGVGNGVPLVMGRVLARAVRRAWSLPVDGDEPIPIDAPRRECKCGCGRVVKGRQLHAGAACRKRAERRRRRGALRA